MKVFRQKIKSVLERGIMRLSPSQSKALSNHCTRIKRRFSGGFKGSGWRLKAIRLMDFIIVRTNGDSFIEFELSNICNARCVFCPYPDMLGSGKKFMHMSSESLSDILPVLSHFDGELVSFTPTTGDTLLHPQWSDFIREVLASPHISRATMFTNAIELGIEQASAILKLYRSENGYKFSQIYFSIGGLDAQTYKELYQVNRFEKVKANINDLLRLLKKENAAIGIHLHFKLAKGGVWDEELAMKLFNEVRYPFVYLSKSLSYFSNEEYRRNPLIDYLPSGGKDQSLPCAYLMKTRFAADGSVWADGCVISEMPGDDSLKLGKATDSWQQIEAKRSHLVSCWQQGELPKPCQACTMYRPVRRKS